MRRRVFLLLTTIASGALAACGNESEAGDPEKFCAEIAANQSTLTDPDLFSSDLIEPFLQLYRDIGDLAPLAIEEEWDQLTLNAETASTVVPDDEESVQAAIVEALRTEQSAVAVQAWVLENCDVDLGPVATIAPQGVIRSG